MDYRRRGEWMRVWIVIAALGLGSCQQAAEQQMQGIQDKVADDAVEQYRMVEKSGSAIDKCVQAGMVSAAYLQAKNDAEYSSWKSIEKLNCANAGVQR